MRNLYKWKLAKFHACKKKGLLVGLAVGVLICLIVAGVIVKMCCLKKKFECMHYDLDDLDDDYNEDDGDCDENGCSFTSEKDFV